MVDIKNKKILVAEDEKAIARALSMKLQFMGYEVVTVYNGKEAVDELVKNKFDMLLMDLVMPVMDGFTALKEIKTKKIKVPVIILSNLSQEEDLKRVKDLGAKGYFVKSNTPLSEIVEKVAAFFIAENKK